MAENKNMFWSRIINIVITVLTAIATTYFSPSAPDHRSNPLLHRILHRASGRDFRQCVMVLRTDIDLCRLRLRTQGIRGQDALQWVFQETGRMNSKPCTEFFLSAGFFLPFCSVF